MKFVPPDLFRRNLIGLLVVLAAFGTLYVTKLGSAWSGYRQTIEPEHTAAAGGSVDAGGLTWQIESVRKLAVHPGTDRPAAARGHRARSWSPSGVTAPGPT